MAFGKGPQQKCREVPGKLQNCRQFGTFIDNAFKSEEARAMCHGGMYMGDLYDECPVRSECYLATIGKRKGSSLPQLNPRAPLPLVAPPPELPRIEIPKLSFKLGDYGLPIETQLPQTPTRQIQEHAKTALEQAVRARMGATAPSAEALPGMQTPYVAHTHHQAEVAPPTFLPQAGESTWDRLLKNIIQGMIAAFGWAIWKFAKTVDLFG